MYRIQCPKCDNKFSRKDVMLRHLRHLHNIEHCGSKSQITETNQPPPPPPPPKGDIHLASPPGVSNSFKFCHPFTAMVSGPTSCGKTYYVKNVLQQNVNSIKPPPERIVWLYKRWQPLYDVIRETVRPNVEFIQGIPLDLENDHFFNTEIRNMIILDDLMSAASKDSRITDLFTEGSHHRNLSVLTINQNLYFSKDPTQRRNCHYIVLFNNPIDQQQVMTLARQMYPRKSEHFMRPFINFTSKPYGYMLLDLKPTTPEEWRMRTDVLFNNGVRMRAEGKVIENNVPMTDDHCSTISQSTQTYKEVPLKVEMSTSSCDDCGCMFENVHDLQRHVKTWCPENMKRKREEYEDELNHKRLISMSDEEVESEGESQEDDYFTQIAEKARENNENEWNEKRLKYMDGGKSEKEAESKADQKIQEKDINDFFGQYGRTLGDILLLRYGPLHKKVMESIDEYLENRIDQKKAVRLSLRKYRHELEDYFIETSNESDNDQFESDNDQFESDNDKFESDESEIDSNDEKDDDSH